MYTEDSVEYSTVNIPIAECTTVKVENIETEDPLTDQIQQGQ